MRKIWSALLLLACGVAQAASFDCSKAKTPQEKAICASPELSAADEQMAAAYRDVLLQAPPEMKEEIRSDQRAWLGWIAVRCKSHASESSSALAACLLEYYDHWTKALQHMVFRRGGVTFLQKSITLYPPDEPIAPGPQVRIGNSDSSSGYLNASWPQASPDTSEWKVWNKAIELAALQTASTGRRPPAESWKDLVAVDMNQDVTASVDLVGKRLVTATIDNQWDGHGIHPNHNSAQLNWMLDEQRALQPEDVFRAGSGWENALEMRSDKYLHRTLDAGFGQDYRNFFQPGEMAKVLHGIATDTANWTLDRRGLTFVFQPYEVACYACTPAPLTIPWAVLKPFLDTRFEIPK